MAKSASVLEVAPSVFTWLLRPAWLGLTPIVPGARIPIHWELVLPGTEGSAATAVARVYLDAVDVLLFESPPTPLTVVDNVLTTGKQTALIESPGPGGTANDLYKIGDKQLRIDVTVSGSDQVFSSTSNLRVVPENIRGDNWSFTEVTGTSDSSAPKHPPAFGVVYHDFIINHPYVLRGSLLNAASNASTTMTGTLVLVESDLQTGASVDLQERAFTIPAGQSEELIFDSINKNWTWLVSGIWVRNYGEPLVKQWDYTVRFTMTDPWGNLYSDFTYSSPPTVHVDVYVSDEKHGYADGALAALGVGIIAGIFTFGAGAAAGQAAAAGLGAKALDPPSPSPRFREAVALPRLVHTHVKHGLGDLLYLLEIANHVVLLLDAGADVRDRVLGAKAAGDRDAMNMQTRAYRDFAAELQASVASLRRATAERVAGLRASPELDSGKLTAGARTWQRQGISPAARQALADGGCSEACLRALEDGLKNADVVALASDPAVTVEVLAYALARASHEILEDLPRVLAGDPAQP